VKRQARARRWSIALGFTLGAATLLFYTWRSMRSYRGQMRSEPYPDPHGILRVAQEILNADGALRNQSVHFVWIAPGILDVTGTVDTVENERRALALLRGVSGARTVLNRLVVLEPARKIPQ
jgi:hypothetical protein